MSDQFDAMWDIAEAVSEAVLEKGFNGFSTDEERIALEKANLETLKSGKFDLSVFDHEDEEGILERFAKSLEEQNYHRFSIAWCAYMMREYGISIKGYDKSHAPYLHE